MQPRARKEVAEHPDRIILAEIVREDEQDVRSFSRRGSAHADAGEQEKRKDTEHQAMDEGHLRELRIFLKCWHLSTFPPAALRTLNACIITPCARRWRSTTTVTPWA
jgi:hypothetical protein